VQEPTDVNGADAQIALDRIAVCSQTSVATIASATTPSSESAAIQMIRPALRQRGFR